MFKMQGFSIEAIRRNDIFNIYSITNMIYKTFTHKTLDYTSKIKIVFNEGLFT